MIKNLLLFAVLSGIVLFHSPSAAKSRWKTGYVVKTNGDTLKGFIAYIETGGTPKRIVFRQEKKGTSTVYKQDDISTACINLPNQDIYFKSFETDIDYSQVGLAYLNISPNPNLLKRKIFAQLLVGGKKSLYYYKDTIVQKKHYLVEAQDKKATDLINKRYFTDESKAIVTYNQQFHSQLLNFFSDCPAITFDRVSNTEFVLSDLMSIAQAYNTCNDTNARVAYEFKKERMITYFGLLAGGTQTSLKMDGGSYSGTDINFNHSTHFSCGIFLNLIAPHTERHWSFYNEVLYTGYHVTSVPYPYGTYFSLGAKRTTDVQADYLKLYTAARYQFSIKKLSSFVMAGIGNATAITSSAYNITPPNAYSPNESKDPTDFRKYEQSYFLGVGVSYKQFGLQLRYEHGNGFSEYADVSTKTTYYTCLLGYTF